MFDKSPNRNLCDIGSGGDRRSAGSEPQKEASILKILVTGGTGFIGSHLCEVLIQRGHHVTILVRPDDDIGWVNDLPLARAIGDITDKGSLTAAVSNVDCVFHLAAALGAPTRKSTFVSMARAPVTWRKPAWRAPGRQSVFCWPLP
jgi:hypothetical protein